MWTGFKKEAFDLLEYYKNNDSADNYEKEVFDPLIRDQFKEIRDFITPLLKEALPEFSITQKNALAKHATRQNTLYNHFWLALYREEMETKSNDLQLFVRIDSNQFKFGLYVGYKSKKGLLDYIQENINSDPSKFISLTKSVDSPKKLTIAKDDSHGFKVESVKYEEAFSKDYFSDSQGVNIYFDYTVDEAIDKGELIKEDIIKGFLNIVPLYKALLNNNIKNIKVEKTVTASSRKKEDNMKNENKNKNLNQIYCGPPGTGKTYEVRQKAIEIVTGERVDDYGLVVEKFKKLKDDGQIDFVTFHPNFGYENFVEGIFPDVESTESLTYQRKDGIFKKICDAALMNLNSSLGSEGALDDEFNKRYQKFTEEIQENPDPMEFATLEEKAPYTARVTSTGGIYTERPNGNGHHIAEKRLRKIFKALVKAGNRNPARTDIEVTSLKTSLL